MKGDKLHAANKVILEKLIENNPLIGIVTVQEKAKKFLNRFNS